MRILMVLHQFYPEFSGGTERVTLNLARAAQRAGHHVQVLACAVALDEVYGQASTHLPGARQAVYEGVPVMLLPRGLMQDLAFHTLDVDTDLVAPLAAWMQHERFELVHVMHTMRMSTAVLAAQRCGLPYVLSLTDFFLACPRINLVTLDNQHCGGPEGGKKCGKDCLSAPWSRETLVNRYETAQQLLAGASIRVAPSEFVAARYRAIFPECAVRVVPHGVDLLALMGSNTFDVAAQGQPAEASLTVGYVGSVIPQKGLTVLLRALARVKAPHLKLKVVGGFYGASSYHDEVQGLVEADTRVEMLGHLEPEDVYAAMRQMQLLCLPSQVPETFSLALHEAAALGVPALVSDLGAPSLQVANNGGGQVVDSADVAAWASALQALVDVPETLVAWRACLPVPVRVEEEAFFYDTLYRTMLTTSIAPQPA